MERVRWSEQCLFFDRPQKFAGEERIAFGALVEVGNESVLIRFRQSISSSHQSLHIRSRQGP
jgi:hypothetical protein